MKKLLFILGSILFILTIDSSVFAAELATDFTLSNSGNVASLTDNSHYTLVNFNAGDNITVTSKEGLIHGIYIAWDCPASEWLLTTDSGEITCGSNGFIHEYVALAEPSTTITINIPSNNMGITGIRVFGEGELPHDVQVWEPSCEKADILIFSAHADDEILFFGGILPTYSYLHDADVQIVYMTQFWGWSKVREHEKLDGLWESGIRNYPVSATFADYKSEDIETAQSQYNYDEMLSFITEQLRRFKPQVVLTHDINGEYGHGYHELTCKAVTEAVEISADDTKYTTSATAYGTWDTPKYYIHLYKENAIKLDYHIPIEEDYAGRTALDIAKEAYTKHVSQQQWWFYVSDTNAYSCADFGLYRSLVGDDISNDILCNIKTYKVQAAEEEARLKAEEESRLLEETLKKEQASIDAAIKESEALKHSSIEASYLEAASIKADTLQKDYERTKNTAYVTIIILSVITVGIIILAVKFNFKE